jgi:hypothetical protein
MTLSRGGNRAWRNGENGRMQFERQSVCRGSPAPVETNPQPNPLKNFTALSNPPPALHSLPSTRPSLFCRAAP